MVISWMICSCQKQNSAAEQQLAQRKTELDARETALDEREKALVERENALVEREKALAGKEKAMTNPRIIPSGIQGQTPEPSQGNAERDRRIQQLPPEVRALVPDPSQVTARDPAKQERPAPRQLGPEDLQPQWQRKEGIQKWQTSGAAVSPAAEVPSSTPSPAVEAASPTPSPAVDDTFSVPSATPQ